MAWKNERVMFVEYSDGRPFVVGTVDDDGKINSYDADWCKRDQTIYLDDNASSSGLGPDLVAYIEHDKHPWWAAPGVTVKNPTPESSKNRLVDPLPEYPPDQLLETAGYSDCEYCSACDDYLPVNDTYHPCAHIRWCDRAGWWSTPDGRCPADCEDCLADGFPVAAKGA